MPIALGERTVTCIYVPKDVLGAKPSWDLMMKLTQAFLEIDPNWRAMVREIYREVTAGWKAEIRSKL